MKKKEQNVRKLTRMGSKRSLGVALPLGLVKTFGWREKQRLVIKKTKGGLEIRDYRNRK